jgi:hypothetical protein
MQNICVQAPCIEDDSGPSQRGTGPVRPYRGADSSGMSSRRAWSRRLGRMENRVSVLQISGREERQYR